MIRIKRTLSLWLILIFVLSFALPAAATEETEPGIYFTVHAFTDAGDIDLLPMLMLKDGQIYIGASDARILAGYDTEEGYTQCVKFTRGAHSVNVEDYILTNNDYYLPFEQTMDALSCVCNYDEDAETLVCLTTSYYYEDMLEECKKVFDGNYLIDFYEGTGWQLAKVYNVLGGMRLDYLWGTYDREQYEKAVAGMMTDQKDETIEWLSDCDSMFRKIAKAASAMKKPDDTDQIKTYAELLGSDGPSIITSLNSINKLVPGLSVENELQILQYVKTGEMGITLYPEAVKYGLLENDRLDNDDIRVTADSVYAFYDKNRPTTEAVIEAMILDVGEGVADKLKDVFLKGMKARLGEEAEKWLVNELNTVFGTSFTGISFSSAWVKFAKVIMDLYWPGLKESTEAVEQAVASRDIQEACINQYQHFLYDGTDSKENDKALKVKYSTILYLRACQYAFSNFSFDDTLSFSVETMKENTQNAISRIAVYEDQQLMNRVKNKPLPSSILNNPFSDFQETGYTARVRWDGSVTVPVSPDGQILELQEILYPLVVTADIIPESGLATYWEGNLLYDTNKNILAIRYPVQEGFTVLYIPDYPGTVSVQLKNDPENAGYWDNEISQADAWTIVYHGSESILNTSTIQLEHGLNEPEYGVVAELDLRKETSFIPIEDSSIPDGIYTCRIHESDLTETNGGLNLNAELLDFYRISDSVIQNLKEGDTLDAGLQTVTVTSIIRGQEADRPAVIIETREGVTVYSHLYEESWIVDWCGEGYPIDSDIPRRVIGTENLFLPDNVPVYDYLTTWGYGINIYGKTADEYPGDSQSQTGPYYKLDRLTDLFRPLKLEYMTVQHSSALALLTVENGQISRVEIQYSP